MSTAKSLKHLSYQKEDRRSLMTLVMVNLNDQLNTCCICAAGLPTAYLLKPLIMSILCQQAAPVLVVF
jgi:hypothetical protein